MNIMKGDIISYEYLNSNDGRKYSCVVRDVQDGWVIDAVNGGTHLSCSFRIKDVIVWEHKKGKVSK